MAAHFGPVLATALGGVGSILVVAAVVARCPGLKDVPPLHELRPEPEAGTGNMQTG